MTSEPGVVGDEVLEFRHRERVIEFPAPESTLVRRRGFWVLATMVVGATAISVAGTGAGRRELVNPGGWPQLFGFFKAVVHPELSLDFLAITWDATLTTLAFAVLGTGLSLVIGVVGGVLASETWWRAMGANATRGRTARRWLAWGAARVTLGAPRGIHEVVWGLFFASFLGIDPLVGVLAIGIPYGAITAKVFSEMLDETSSNAYVALRSAGAGRLIALIVGVLPQALPDLISYAFYRFECSIRGATILGIIGAGGLGFQLSLSFVSLQYGEIWTLIFALLLVSGSAEWWGASVRRRLRAPRPTLFPGAALHRPPLDRTLVASTALAVLLLPLMGWHLGVDPSRLWSAHARSLLGTVVGSSVPPDLAPPHLLDLLRLSLDTLQMAILAIAMAASAAMLVAFGAARGEMRRIRVIAVACRAVLLFSRAVPPPVWALLLLFVFLPGSLPGTLALAVYNFGILGRLMAEIVDNMDPAAAHALRRQGASAPQAWLFGVMPAVTTRFIAVSLYRWEVTIRETVVVGLVGAGGLGALLELQLASFNYRGVASTVGALIVLTVFADLIGSWARRTMR